jgi:hypothetical protein
MTPISHPVAIHLLSASDLIKAIAELIASIAKLAWPAAAVTAIIIFRPQIAHILDKLKKGKFGPGEVELKDDVEQLSQKAAEIENAPPSELRMEVPIAPTIRPENIQIRHEEVTQEVAPEESLLGQIPPVQLGGTSSQPDLQELFPNSDLDRIVDDWQSPSAGILLLGAKMQRRVNFLIATLGLWPEHTHFFTRNVEILCRRRYLPESLTDSAKLFWNIRSRLAHGAESSPALLNSAFQSGVTLYKALLDVPFQTSRVRYTNILLYPDEMCTSALNNSRGLILEMHTPGGSSEQIFPVKTDASYRVGSYLSWEWGNESLGECWYRDPRSNDCLYAWSGSRIFAGRDLKQILDESP